MATLAFGQSTALFIEVTSQVIQVTLTLPKQFYHSI